MVQTPDITPGRKETETERGWGREARQHRKSKITNDAAAHEETETKIETESRDAPRAGRVTVYSIPRTSKVRTTASAPARLDD